VSGGNGAPAIDESSMRIFSRFSRRHLVPLHRDNARSKDWVIMREANTIVGPSRENFRVDLTRGAAHR
jgi:hypothetical protein